MPANIQEHIKMLNNLGQTLAEDVKSIREGKIDLKKAGVINRHSSTAIKACAQGVLLANHQQIQRDKVKMQADEQAVKADNIALQRERIIERQLR